MSDPTIEDYRQKLAAALGREMRLRMAFENIQQGLSREARTPEAMLLRLATIATCVRTALEGDG
jgi:hypothetical protein